MEDRKESIKKSITNNKKKNVLAMKIVKYAKYWIF